MNHDIRNLRNLNDAPMGESSARANATRNFDIRNLQSTPPHAGIPSSHVQAHPATDHRLLELIRSDESIRCFGGYLFRRDNPQYGHVICFAVENMRPEDVVNADKWYALFGRMSHLGMLHRTSSAPIPVGNYTVFEFVASVHDKSIRDHLKAVEPMRTSHTALMNQLIEFIHSYSQELEQLNNANYVPLCCLSKDTVLIDPNGRMKILPLRANRGIYPIEIPQEVSVGEQVDERSDLFSAAYLAVEVYSKNRNCAQLTEPDSDVIRNCLKAVHDWRPTLAEVRAADSSAPASNPAPRFTRVSKPVSLDSDKLRGQFRKVKGYLQDLVRPYELEESETVFERDGTIHENGGQKNEPLEMGGDPNSTFGPANR